MTVTRFHPGDARVWQEDGIVFIEYVPGATITRDMAARTWLARQALLVAEGKQKHQVVMIGSRIADFEFGAYRFSVSRQVTETISVAAIVTTSALERHLAAVFVNMWKPAYTVRVFDSREAAIAWLRTQPDA